MMYTLIRAYGKNKVEILYIGNSASAARYVALEFIRNNRKDDSIFYLHRDVETIVEYYYDDNAICIHYLGNDQKEHIPL